LASPFGSEHLRALAIASRFFLPCGDAIAFDGPQEYDQSTREINQAITDIMTPARSRSTRQENSTAEEKKIAAAAMPDQLLYNSRYQAIITTAEIHSRFLQLYSYKCHP
jgi:hypothetical protein